jgi:hypothetical protein
MRIDLLDSTRYWLSIDLGGNGQILWKDSVTNFDHRVCQGDALSLPLIWFAASVTNNDSTAFQLHGSPKRMPAPASLLLTVVGLGALASARSRRPQTKMEDIRPRLRSA